MKLFLDDVRNPSDCVGYMHTRIGKLNPIYLEGDWYIVKNYTQFVQAILKYAPDISHVSFDHDLADEHYSQESQFYIEKTGYDCAKWMKEHYNNKGWSYPIMFVHSMNPVGTENIIKLFKK